MQGNFFKTGLIIALISGVKDRAHLKKALKNARRYPTSSPTSSPGQTPLPIKVLEYFGAVDMLRKDINARRVYVERC